MKILHIVGARPNFMKAAPMWSSLAEGCVQGTRSGLLR